MPKMEPSGKVELAEPAYHRFVNTTPKPRATKKRRGELVGPPPPPLCPLLVVAAAAAEVTVGLLMLLSLHS